MDNKKVKEITRSSNTTVALTAILVVVAAIIRPSLTFTLLGLMIVIAAHEAGHFLVARRAGMATPEFMVGFGPTLYAHSGKSTVFGLKAIPLGGYVRISGMSPEEEVDPENEGTTYRAKPYRWKVAVSAAGPAANLVLAFFLFFLTLTFVGVYTPSDEPVVSSIAPESPAEQARIPQGATIVAINGTPTDTWQGIAAALQGKEGQLSTVRYISPGASEPSTAVVTPEKTNDGRVVLGINRVVTQQRSNPVAAVGGAAILLRDATVGTVYAIGGIIGSFDNYVTALFSGGVPENESRFLSPLGASQVAGEVAETNPLALLPLVAFVNVMLAVFNLLPIPPLDGGHIVVASVEKVASFFKRRPVTVPRNVLLPVTVGAWAILIFIGFSAIWLDVFSPVQL